MKIRTYIVMTMLLLSAGFCLAAQTNFAPTPDGLYQPESWMNSGDRSFVETAPPTTPVRGVAEYEPATQVIIRYPLGIPVSLVVALSNTAQVVCIVSGASVQTQATNAFNSAGVNMDNLTFMTAPTDSYWTRDYGPWFEFDGNNQLGIVDFRYNRPRPNDDEIARTFATNNNYPLFGMNLNQTGGNYMTDGLGTAVQTQIAYTENNTQTQAQVNQKMHDYLGIDNYHVMQDPNGTYINHVDCWGKFLAPDKVLISRVSSNNSNYQALEDIATQFATTNCAWGYPYKVYRADTSNNTRPVTNSLILNHKVFVPVMSNNEPTLQVYRNALPGYEVIGFLGIANAPWENTDALHCRTHEVPDRQMLYIAHTPLHGVQEYTDHVAINAYIYPYSNTALIEDSVFVDYQRNGGTWQRLVMSNVSGHDYRAYIEDLAPGDSVHYYIHAVDSMGKSNTHPMTGRLDSHVFYMQPDTEAPVITYTTQPSIYEGQHEVAFIVHATDNYYVEHVYLHYKINNGAEQQEELYSEGPQNDFFALLNIDMPQNGTFSYYYEAFDFFGNTARAPENGWIDLQATGVNDNTNAAVSSSFDRVSPNPFVLSCGSSLHLQYSSAAKQRMTAKVFNVKGQCVSTLSAQADVDGQHILSWDGRMQSGKMAAAGVYYISLQDDRKVLGVKKVLVLK